MSSAPTTANRHLGNKYPSRSPRQKIDTLMYVDLGLENGGFPINVSEGGMAFHGIRPMQKDQLIHVKFKLPGLSDSVESAAQIAWLNDLGKGGGLRFIDLPEGNRHLIKEWLALQTSFRGLADSAPSPHKPGATKNFKPLSDIRVASQHDSSAKITSKEVAAPLDSFHFPVSATKAIEAPKTLAVPIRSLDSARVAGFRDPLLETESRNAWSSTFSLALFAFLVIGAILGVMSYQFHWRLQLPAIVGNPAQMVSEFVTPAAPPLSSEMQTAAAPPSDPADSRPAAPPASAAAPDKEVQPVETAAPEPTAPVSRPAKMAIPLKINPPRSWPQQIGMNAKPVTPPLMAKSPAGDIAPPTLAIPAKPESAPQLPALLMQPPPPAASLRQPAQQSGKFDAPQLVVRKNPVYPSFAQGSSLTGSVELHFIIGTDGHVRDVTVVKGNLMLARAAVDAIQTWRYQPARRDGVPVETQSSMVFVFKSN